MPLHSKGSFQDMQSRPLTPNIVELTALGGLVLNSVLTQSGVGAMMTAAWRCSVQTMLEVARAIRICLFCGVRGLEFWFKGLRSRVRGAE